MNPARRQAVEKAFQGTGRPYAAETARGAGGQLDEYAHAWAAARHDACEATHRRKEQSQEILETRVACYDEALDQFSALTALFMRADETTLTHARAAAAALPSLAMCRGGAIARRGIVAPLPAQAAAVSSLRPGIAQLSALRLAGKYVEAAKTGEGLAASARQIGYGPALGEIAWNLGLVYAHLGRTSASESTLYEAVVASDRGRDDRTRARAWLGLLYVVAYADARYERAETFAGEARAALERSGGDELLESSLHNYLGLVYMATGRLEDAQVETEAALSVRRVIAPNSDLLFASLSNLAIVRDLRGDLDQSRALLREALDVANRGFGASHPLTVDVWNSLGNVSLRARTFEAAADDFRTALVIGEPTLGPNHFRMGEARMGLANAQRELGELGAALTEAKRALAILEEGWAGEHERKVPSLVTLARVHSSLREMAEARALLDRALRIGAKGDAPLMARTEFELAKVLRAGESKRAHELALSARERFAAAPGWGHERDEVQAWIERNPAGSR